MQRPRRRDARVLLTQRAGRRVARVHEQPLACVRLPFVHRLELGHRHVDLAAYLEHLGVGPTGSGQFLGHVHHRGHVRRHVLAGDPVTPRGGLDELPALVDQRHRHAVDLGLAGERERLEVEPGVQASQPLRPRPQLGLFERVVEAHHRRAVADLGEETRRSGAHRPGRRVGPGQRRVVRLEPAQLHDEEVVFGVGYLGRVDRVVQLVVVDDQRANSAGRRRRLGGDGRGHAQAATPAPTTASGSSSS